MELNSHSLYRAAFADRQDAGRQLAAALMRYKDEQPVVLALPRGGVPVGFEIAKALAAPLDVIFVRKLSAPGAPELGLGAIVDGAHPRRILNESIIDALQVTPDYIESEVRVQLKIIEERKLRYRGGRQPIELEKRTVILTDDGIATGGTIRVALRALELAEAGRTVLAVPVAPLQTWQSLAGEADESLCLLSPADFHSVGFYYADFEQTSDDEVIELLRKAGSPVGGAVPSRAIRWGL